MSEDVVELAKKNLVQAEKEFQEMSISVQEEIKRRVMEVQDYKKNRYAELALREDKIKRLKFAYNLLNEKIRVPGKDRSYTARLESMNQNTGDYAPPKAPRTMTHHEGSNPMGRPKKFNPEGSEGPG